MTRAVVQNRDGTLNLVVVMARSGDSVLTNIGTFDRGTNRLINQADYPVLLFVGSGEAAREFLATPEQRRGFKPARGRLRKRKRGSR